MHELCSKLGLATHSLAPSPILAVKIEPSEIETVNALLSSLGIVAKPVLYPVVRRGKETIRFTLTASQGYEADEALRAFLMQFSRKAGAKV